MRNADYWRQRFALLEAVRHNKGLEYLEALEEETKRAQAAIRDDIERWYARFAKNNSISLVEAKKLLNTRELEEFRWTVEEYIKHGEDNLDGRWQQQLENASARVHISRLEALQIGLQQQAEVLYGNRLGILDGIMRAAYVESFYRTAFELQRGVGVGWQLAAIDTRQLDRVLSKPWTTDGRTFSDRIWTNKAQLIGTVRTEMTQAIIRGDSPDKAINAIAKQFNVDRGKAGRLVMTERAFFSSAAQQDCFKELDVEQYQIIETLDIHTCSVCGDLDGKVFPMSDFEAGVTAPPFHPWCRGCTAPYFADNHTAQRAARNPETGKTEYVPGDMTYRQWKEKFVDGVDSNEEPGIMKDIELRNIPITDEAIERIPVVECDALTHEQAGLLAQRHRELLEFVRGAPPGMEAIYYCDMELNVLSRHIGRQVGKVQATRINVPHIIMHNHPSGLTFTHNDVQQFVKNPSTRIVSAVGNNGNVYLLEKMPDFSVTAFQNYCLVVAKAHPDFMKSPENYLAFIEDLLKGAGAHGLIYQKK